MKSNRLSDPTPLLAKIDRRSLGLSEHLWNGPAGLRAIAHFLAEQPRDTVELAERFQINRNDLAMRLSAGSRHGLLTETPRASSYGKGKIGRRPSQWALNQGGARILAAASQATLPTTPVAKLPRAQQEILERWDFESDGLTAQNAWRIQELAAVIGMDRKTITLLDLDKLLGASRGYAKCSVSLADGKGYLIVHRPPKVGAIGRPINSYEVRWDVFKPRSNGSRRAPAPQRSCKQLGDMPPAADRRTQKQRNWCNAVSWNQLGLERAQYWADAQSVLAAVGTSRCARYADFLAENGWGMQALEKCVRRMKKAALLELLAPLGGHRAFAKEWRPNWARIELAAGKQQAPPPESKITEQPKAESPQPAIVNAMRSNANDSLTSASQPVWNAEWGTLKISGKEVAIAGQAKKVRAVLSSFQASGWPSRIDSPFRDAQTHHNTIRALNKIGVLKFSSAQSGTAICRE